MSIGIGIGVSKRIFLLSHFRTVFDRTLVLAKILSENLFPSHSSPNIRLQNFATLAFLARLFGICQNSHLDLIELVWVSMKNTYCFIGNALICGDKTTRMFRGVPFLNIFKVYSGFW